MTTSSISELSPSLQSLVDARMDAIERVLLTADVSREERRGILSEAEAHIFELLGRDKTGEPTRERVLGVLSQLDSPESYAPEGFDRQKLQGAWSTPAAREPQLSLLAVGSAAAGVFVAPALVASALLFQDEMLMSLGAIGLLVVSSIGCFSMVRIHRSHGWLYGMLPAMFATMLFPLLAANCFALLCFIAMGEFTIVIGFVLLFLALNVAMIYGAWRLCTSTNLRSRKPLGTNRSN